MVVSRLTALLKDEEWAGTIVPDVGVFLRGKRIEMPQDVRKKAYGHDRKEGHP